MKKLLLLGIACTTLLACQQDNEPATGASPVAVTATLPQNPATRLAYEYIDTQTDNYLKVTWAVGDKIIVDGQESEPLTAQDGAGTGTATFRGLPAGINASSVIYYDGNDSGSYSQAASDDPAHLTYHHQMIGTYAEGNITFEHNNCIFRVALSGLDASRDLKSLQVSNLISFADGTHDGTYVAWMVMNPATAATFTFKVWYEGNDGDPDQTYTHPTPLTTTAGKLYHCTINMETKVAFIDTGATWGNENHTGVPTGYDGIVYDQATFLAMTATGKKYLQVADITLTDAYAGYFEGTYNGNGYTITGDGATYAFTTLDGASIANVHTLGIPLANQTSYAAKIAHCSSSGAVMVNTVSVGHYATFTLCSTDQDKLTTADNSNFAFYRACWFDGAAQGTSESGYVWNEAGKLMESVPVSEYYDVATGINWDYKYTAP